MISQAIILAPLLEESLNTEKVKEKLGQHVYLNMHFSFIPQVLLDKCVKKSLETS